MSRPPVGDGVTAVAQTTLAADELQWVEEAASRTNTSRSWILRQLVRIARHEQRRSFDVPHED